MEKKKKNIRDYLDVPEDRIDEITKMAEKTILKSFQSLLRNINRDEDESGKGYDTFSDENGKYLLEDAAKLKTVQEGIVYGMASQIYSETVSNELARFEEADVIRQIEVLLFE